MLPRVQIGLEATLSTLGRSTAVDGLPSLGPEVDLAPRDLIGLDNMRSGQEFRAQEFTQDERITWSVGFHHPFSAGPCDKILLENCAVYRGRKWVSRSHGMRALNRIMHCAFFDTWPEHVLYWNLAGYGGGLLKPRAYALSTPALEVGNCYFENTGSQDIQLVQRATDWYGETPKEDITPGGPIVLHDNLSRNAGCGIGDGTARSSFAISCFQSQNDVVVARCAVDKSMQPKSTGLLLIEGRGRARITGFVGLANNLTQPAVKARGVKELVIERSHYYCPEGQAWLDIEATCKNVSISDCTGNMTIRRDGRVLSTVEKGWIS